MNHRRHNHCPCSGDERKQLNQMKNLSTKIGGAILTLAFIFGISAAAGMTAQAQDRRDRDYRQDRDRDYRQDRRRDRDDRWSNNQSQNRDWRNDRERERREEA